MTGKTHAAVGSCSAAFILVPNNIDSFRGVFK